MKNTGLHAAKAAKKDNFYTQRSDIERELRHYWPHFEGKVVYCNCDDPRVSEFFHYFSHNFEHLRLTRLITTCYKNQNPSLFSRHDTERAIILEYDGFRDGERVPRPEDIGIKHLEGDGDFRSKECINLLKQADIVVTNPPFSLFREYVAQLIEHEKPFLILGDQNAVTYKEIFPLIKDGKMWLGNDNGGIKWFRVPMDYEIKTESRKRIVDGEQYFSMGRINWYTNLDIRKRHDDLILYRRYTPAQYPRYDNYDAINVNKVQDIPMDYPGVMGVPITFLDKHNPDQFEIVGITKTWFGAATKKYPPQVQVSVSGQRTEVTKLNDGPALQIDGPASKTYYIVDGKYYVQAYARVLIRNRSVQS